MLNTLVHLFTKTANRVTTSNIPFSELIHHRNFSQLCPPNEDIAFQRYQSTLFWNVNHRTDPIRIEKPLHRIRTEVFVRNTDPFPFILILIQPNLHQYRAQIHQLINFLFVR
ncbi:hypothetical protein Hanom_Chr05g00402911 [Helianthus anomalus]